MYMEILRGFKFKGQTTARSKHRLKFHNNLYGQKQSGRVWNKYLTTGLVARGFRKTLIDPYIYYRVSTVVL